MGEKQPTILKWRILTTTNDLERVSAVALPKLPISISNTDLKVASDTKFFPGLGERRPCPHIIISILEPLISVMTNDDQLISNDQYSQFCCLSVWT